MTRSCQQDLTLVPSKATLQLLLVHVPNLAFARASPQDHPVSNMPVSACDYGVTPDPLPPAGRVAYRSFRISILDADDGGGQASRGVTASQPQMIGNTPQ